MSKLFYRKPSTIWEEALPLGNGRLGAMVYGSVDTEQIQVNEESVWLGGEVDRNNPYTLRNLPKVRQLLIDGRIREAEELMLDVMSGRPAGMKPYQTLGEILLTFGAKIEAQEYERSLCLETAVARTGFTAADTKYERTYFISHPADCMVMHFTAKGKNRLSCSVALQRGDAYDGIAEAQSGIRLWGNLGEGGSLFAVMMKADVKGGSVSYAKERLEITDAEEITLYYSAATTFEKEKQTTEVLRIRLEEILQKAMEKGYETLLREHIADYKSLFDRCRLELSAKEERKELPTDERLCRSKDKEGMAELTELYFDFGRYLLISCSRDGGLPATLQGLWNKDMTPPWESKFTININTEMNYWPAESCNLSECHMPLFDHIERMVKNGRRTARVMYGCRGIVAHHNTDIHGDTAPQDQWIPGTYWVMGAAWLCTHQWTHYLYTGDLAFLQRTYPVMAEAALFFFDFLVEYNGYLVTIPSVSPENTYILPNGEQGANGIGVTMDNQILRDLFTQCIEAYRILKEADALTPSVLKKCREAEIGDPEAFTEQVKVIRERLIPTRISERGTIMEWQEDYREAEPGHRHISHLYGLHPSAQITMDETPELAAAARKTLEARLSQGGGHTGWSRAWIINHYAKLWDGEEVYDNLQKLFASSTYPNLFDMHPPFQIDGNFGATAAIAEMLVQSNLSRILLLPALPGAFANGKVSGIRVVGGGEVSLSWKEGKLERCRIKADRELKTRVLYQGKGTDIFVEKGAELILTPENFR